VVALRRTQANGLHRKVIEAMTTNETAFFRDAWVRAGRIAVELELVSTAVRGVYQKSGPATPLRHQGWDPGAVWPCRRLAWPFP
jgi:hypothetical protein